MSKIKFKKIGSTFNHDGRAFKQSVSAFNESNRMLWLDTYSTEKEDFFFYMDNAIIDVGLRSNDIKYGWLLESRGYIQPVINNILSSLDLIKQHYKYIFTCQLDLVAMGPPFAYVISNGVPWTKKENYHLSHTKEKLISMLVSHNQILSGHHTRIQYLNDNRQYLDLYGRGQGNEVESVEDAFMNYYFTVSMENDYSDAYFTERLTGPMSVGTVPIYQGSKAVVEQYFDSNGVLWADETDLKELTKIKYAEMVPNIINNFNIVKNNLPLPEDYLLTEYLEK